MKKQSKHHIHSLTVRITAIAIIPLCILACILTIIGIGSIRSGIQDEVESTLQASTMGVQGMLDALKSANIRWGEALQGRAADHGADVGKYGEGNRFGCHDIL